LGSLVAFVRVEQVSAAPMVPLSMFASPLFRGANLVTFFVYGAFGGIFFLLVLQLQVVAGFSPLAAGTATLPITVLMLLLSARAGALSDRIGPRLPMTLGPLLCAAAVLLMLRIGPAASYVVEVLPAVLVLGLGLALLVAPLTASALAAVDAQHAGVASGVNNAVARAAGLLAVAVLPSAAGLSGDDYTDPASFATGFRVAALVSAGLLVVAGLIAALTIPRRARPPTSQAGSERRPLHCAVNGPPSHLQTAPRTADQG
jgi:MFS family permease